MNAKNKNDSVIDEILKEAHNNIEPPDSWQALRARIDSGISSKKNITISFVENIVFWRRLSFGMAACFLISAGILFYFIGTYYKGQKNHNQQIAIADNLFNQADLNRLSFTFSQVQQLFGQQSQWIIVGSGGSTQMGVAQKMISRADNSKIIVVRLAVNLDNMESSRQYFDIVTFSNQQTSFQLPITAASIDISLTPILRNNGKIEVEVSAQIDGRALSDKTNSVFSNKYIRLISMQANGVWVNIEGIAQSALPI
jgi:hypothetical protein